MNEQLLEQRITAAFIRAGSSNGLTLGPIYRYLDVLRFILRSYLNLPPLGN